MGENRAQYHTPEITESEETGRGKQKAHGACPEQVPDNKDMNVDKDQTRRGPSAALSGIRGGRAYRNVCTPNAPPLRAGLRAGTRRRLDRIPIAFFARSILGYTIHPSREAPLCRVGAETPRYIARVTDRPGIAPYRHDISCTRVRRSTSSAAPHEQAYGSEIGTYRDSYNTERLPRVSGNNTLLLEKLAQLK